MNPLVSIIIPVYNGEKFIARAIESCIQQTYSNIEILVINNGSTDSTLSIVTSFKDERLKILNCSKGRSKARNLGLKEAKGRYINFLDADDTLEIDRISKGVIFLEKNPHIFAHSVSVRYLNNYHKTIKIVKPTYIMNKNIIKSNPFPINSILFFNNQKTYFKEKLEYNEDWLFFALLLKDKKVFIEHGFLGASVYIHDANTMSNVMEMLEHELIVYKKIVKIYDKKHIFDKKKMKLYFILLSQNIELKDKNFEIFLAKLCLKTPFINSYIKNKVSNMLLKFEY